VVDFLTPPTAFLPELTFAPVLIEYLLRKVDLKIHARSIGL
jgi:hypothetical protein